MAYHGAPEVSPSARIRTTAGCSMLRKAWISSRIRARSVAAAVSTVFRATTSPLSRCSAR